jgi:hypothetical protein
MDRFTRFKILRALWARARALLAWLHVPPQQQLQYRAQYWQRVQVAERNIRDGIVRGTGDPDSYVRPQMPDRPDTQARAGQAQAWQAQWEAQRQWYEAWQRQAQQRRN